MTMTVCTPVRFVHNQVILMHLNTMIFTALCLNFLSEFAENGSIYDYIHQEHKQPSLTQRLLWAKEVAEGGLSDTVTNVQQFHVVTKDYSRKILRKKKYCIALKFHTSKFSQILQIMGH